MALAYFGDLATVAQQIDKAQLMRLREMVRSCTGMIWIAGNGGNYANALHWAVDLAKMHNRAIGALGANGGLMTAYTNDISYADAYAIEFSTLARDGDLLICLSASGTSPNIVRLIATAKERNIPSAIITGVISNMPAQADHIVRIWSKDYAIIEDCTAAIGHWLTKALYERSSH